LITRPTVLLIDRETARRRALANGLARFAYEVVPVSSAEQGLRFAEGLGPSVIVAPADLEGFGDGAILERFSLRDPSMQRSLVLLGSAPSADDNLPAEVLYLDIRGRSPEEIVRRLRLVLVGREVGLEADYGLRTLLGDLVLVPLLEVLRRLHHARVSGSLAVGEDGMVELVAGAVIAAGAGRARGIKALGRLARKEAGSLRLTLGTAGAGGADAHRELELTFDELIVRTIEDMQMPLPELAARVELATDVEAETESDPVLCAAIAAGVTVAKLFDALSIPDGRIAERLSKLVARGVVSLRRPQPATAVVVDSTCDLPPAMLASHELNVMPLMVCFGDDHFRDGIDIKARDFYQEIANAQPSTAPPTVEELTELYKQLLPQQDVVSVHLSQALSETYARAVKAAERSVASVAAALRPAARIEVVDGRGVSLGTGLLALFAARLAARGHPAGAIAERLEGWRDRVHTLFLVDTFDYLLRGGRIGRARAAIGKLLGIKPILGVEDGEIAAIDRVRGGRRAHPRMVELVAARVDSEKPIVAAVAHAAAPVWADRLSSLLAERFTVSEAILSDIGPVVGTHAGPGCVGCVIFQPSEQEWAEIAPLSDPER